MILIANPVTPLIDNLFPHSVPTWHVSLCSGLLILSLKMQVTVNGIQYILNISSLGPEIFLLSSELLLYLPIIYKFPLHYLKCLL